MTFIKNYCDSGGSGDYVRSGESDDSGESSYSESSNPRTNFQLNQANGRESFSCM